MMIVPFSFPKGRLLMFLAAFSSHDMRGIRIQLGLTA
jgi:hypothetical protein